MHRSRLALLVVVAPVAACSTRKSSDAAAPLSQDSSLAHLDLRQPAARRARLPDACSSVAVAAQPAAADRQQAAVLTRQAYSAELVGHVEQARTLLHRATELDGTDKTVAYHLGRTSEALGDHAEAVSAYCHYLALAPAAPDTADVRQRVSRLSLAPQRVASTATAAPPRPTAVAMTSQSVARAPQHRQATQRVASAVRVGPSTRVAYPEGDVQGAGGPVSSASQPPVYGGEHHTTADGDVIAAGRPMPSTSARPSSSTRRGGLSRAEGAGLGAATGALIAGVTGHSMKSAVIGAAAGGLLGAVVAGGSQ